MSIRNVIKLKSSSKLLIKINKYGEVIEKTRPYVGSHAIQERHAAGAQIIEAVGAGLFKGRHQMWSVGYYLESGKK